MNIKENLVKLADMLDRKKLNKEANFIDSILQQAAKDPHWFKDKDTVYFEESGTTRKALDSLKTVLKHHAKDIVSAEFLKNDGFGVMMIGLVLTSNSGTKFVIPAGFAEGYSGEGPRGFTEAKELLEANKLKYTEKVLDKSAFDQIFHVPHQERYKKDTEDLGEDEATKRWWGERRKHSR